MSIVVYSEGRVIWSPALRVGRLFADEMSALERVVQMPSGFVLDAADEVHLVAPRFTVFVDALLEQLEEASRGDLLAMMLGPTQVAVALLHRVTGTWPEASGRLEPMIREAATLLERT
jgi:hypothetical protein